uniref:Uncharacterized protein n=1 Tax=Kalanchoe fedtschenkoi TaxID=63787 RepID=A0A7N0UW47_KALFE
MNLENKKNGTAERNAPMSQYGSGKNNGVVESKKKIGKFFSVYVEKVRNFPKELWKLGKDDPRRVTHALKVGISLTLVSLLYLLEPLFKGIGANAIWAVMTVVVVLEFTAGATLCKGLNRGLGTLLAGSLAFLFEFIATESGQIFRAVFIGIAVFTIGAAATYMRFIPYIKKNFDYGVVIFLITFNLITASSYRVDNVIKVAHERFYTIAIGCGICLLMSLMIFPNWSGEALHDSTVLKFEGLAKSIEACVSAYFKDSDAETKLDESTEDSIYKGYKAVLDSKSTDETLALHASWEPRHSSYRFPWQQYVKVGAVLRQFGYTVVALHGCLQTEIQAPSRVRILFKGPCIRVAGEVSKVLRELAQSIRNRRRCSPELLSDHLHEALHDLNKAIKSQPRLFLGTNSHRNMLALAAATAKQEKDQGPHPVALSSVKTESSALVEWKAKRAHLAEQAKENERKVLRKQLSKIAITSLEFSEALPFAAFASLLVELVAKLDQVIEEVEELGSCGRFKEYTACDEVVVNCEQNKMERALGNHQGSNGAE